MTVNPDVVVPLVLLYDVPDTVEPVEAQFKGTGRSGSGSTSACNAAECRRRR